MEFSEKQIDVLIKKLNEIMIRKRSPYIEQKSDGSYFDHGKSKLTDAIVKDHIRGKRTIGVRGYNGRATIFFVFDIDAQDDRMTQIIGVRRTINELKKAGIDESEIHVLFSGNKGYHVQLFFESLPITFVAAFGKSIKANVGEFGGGMDLRPESPNGVGVKLPFAIHKKTGKRAVYVDLNTLDPISQQVDYFLSIMPMPKERIEVIVRTTLDSRQELHDVDNRDVNPTVKTEKRRSIASMTIDEYMISGVSVTEIWDVLRNGLKQKGTRNDYQGRIATMLKGDGYSEENAVQLLRDWAGKQFENGMTKCRNIDEAMQLAEESVRYVYSHDSYVGYGNSHNEPPRFLQNDVFAVTAFRDDNNKRVMAALIIIGRLYNDKGRFFASMDDLAKVTGLTRKTVSKVIDNLINLRQIETDKEYRFIKGHARYYTMPHLVDFPPDGGEVIPFPRKKTLRQVCSDMLSLSSKLQREFQYPTVD